MISDSLAEIIIEYGSRRGMLAGLCTILARHCGTGACPGFLESGREGLKFRGLSLDISRGAIPRLRTFRELIPRLFLLGCTHFALYIEDTLENDILRPCFPARENLSLKELSAIRSLCLHYGIELFPEVQFLGHLEKVLGHPELKAFADRRDPGCLDASNRAGTRFVDSFVQKNISAFASDLVNIGFDETARLPPEKVRKRLRQVIGLLPGKQIALWADQLPGNPELLRELPPNTLLFNWNYFHEKAEFFRADASKLEGFPQVLCPAVWSWLKLIPDYRRSFANIAAAVEAAAECKLQGALLTLWGDGGNESLLDLSLPAVELFFALCNSPRSRTGTETKILRNYPWLKALIGLDAALPYTHRYYLWEDPLRSPYSCWSGFRSVIANYQRFARKLERALPGKTDNLPYRLLCFLKKKVALSMLLHDPAAHPRQAANDLESLAAELRALRCLYCDQWLRIYKPGGLKEQVRKFRALEKRLLFIRDRIIIPGKLPAWQRKLAGVPSAKPPQTTDWREIFRKQTP